MYKFLYFMQNLVYITFFENFKKNVYNRNFLWYYITNDRCFSTGCLPQSHNIRQFKHLSFFLQTKCLQAKCLATCPLSCVSVISTIDTRSTTSQILANQMFVFEQQSYDRCYGYIIGCGVCVAIVLFNIINAERSDNSLLKFEYANHHQYNITKICATQTLLCLIFSIKTATITRSTRAKRLHSNILP